MGKSHCYIPYARLCERGRRLESVLRLGKVKVTAGYLLIGVEFYSLTTRVLYNKTRVLIRIKLHKNINSGPHIFLINIKYKSGT
jgi:hypothetical protein